MENGRTFEYEGGNCLRCRRNHDPSRDLKTIHSRLVAVAGDPEYYRQALRHRCRNRNAHYLRLVGQDTAEALGDDWDNYFDPQTDGQGRLCPLCGAQAGPRATTAWVRTFERMESLEELQTRELVPGDEDEYRLQDSDNKEEANPGA